ncbi:MAG: hypothetical protein HeimC3_54050 [Candidatus Heimdallarchaeota archaeon LC_3]|nr:MAG: hypothetical protein HeimC3_54050 [Candidatus Heimdallarchaeota archaeon LC_3]
MIKPEIKKYLNEESIFGKRKSNTIQRSFFSSLGIIVNVIWIISVFLQPPLEVSLFLGMGLIGLLLALFTRLYTRLNTSSQYSEIQGGGSIVGFAIACLIANSFYPNNLSTISVFDIILEANYVIQMYIVIIFLIWFIIPTSITSQDIIFGLPLSLSYLILNFWKLLILMKFFIQLEPRLHFANETINLIILLFAYFELILLLFRQKRIQIIDIILDIQQIFLEIFRGPGQALKWSFIIIFFLIFDMVTSDIWMLSIIAFSMIIGLISFTTMLTRVGLNSGIFKTKLESGKALAPTVFDEIRNIDPDDLPQNFFRISNSFSIKTKTKIIHFNKDNILFRIPLTDTLEDVVGVYVATMHFSSPSTKILKEIIPVETKTAKPLSNISIKSVRKFSFEEWKKIKSNTESLQSEEVLTKLGFKSQEEFNKRIQKGLTGIIGIQEQIRARVRGLPAISGDPTKYTVSWHGESHIAIPQEIITQISERGATILEIIPGKEEFLFYVKVR